MKKCSVSHIYAAGKTTSIKDFNNFYAQHTQAHHFATINVCVCAMEWGATIEITWYYIHVEVSTLIS